MSLVLKLFFIFLFLTVKTYSEIPVIVISPSKVAQSISSVGSDITVINMYNIESLNKNFLGNIFDSEVVGSNFSNQGGTGTNSLIQLRGLPKRYTNIYIDGVKQSDPSSPDNAFYINNLTSGSVKSVEILKGNQSSVYGSSAIGGVVNIFSRNGKEKDNKFFQINSGSNKTRNAIITYGDNKEKYNYSFTLEKYFTNGISAMNDNTERDSYKNDNLHASFGTKINDTTKLETNFKFFNTFLNYDEVTKDRDDHNNTKNEERTANIKIINSKNYLTNSLIMSHYYTKRKVANYNQSNTLFYYGERKNINYFGEYNIDLDRKIVFGLDNEFNRANYSTWTTSGNKITDEMINSQFVDLQQRYTEKLFTTIGFRNDIHSVAGDFKTARLTNSYKHNQSTKFRSSLGTGIRFGSLNDYYYDTNIKDKKNLKPEKSYSIDLGIDKKFEKLKTKLNITFFYTEYHNNISNWASNTDGGTTSYAIDNSNGKIKSKGLELKLYKQFNNSLFGKINYSFIKAYDGEDCDDPDKAFSSCLKSTYPVRIPKHSFIASLKKNLFNNFTSEVMIKYVSKRRDYGNANNNYEDVILGNYYKVDFINNFSFFKKKYYFNISNLLNKKYQDAYQYNTGGRRFDFGIKQTF